MSLSDIQQYEMLENIFNSLSMAVILKDLNNNIIKINQTSAKSLNMAVKDIEGKNCVDIFGESADFFYKDDLEIIRTKKPIIGRMERVMIAEGAARWARTDKVPLFDQEGNVSSIIIVSQDITEQIEAEEQALKLKHLAEVGIRTAEIVHNLKNPLTIAVGNTYLVENLLPKSTPVEKIKKSHSEILNVISDILNSTKTSQNSDERISKVSLCVSKVIEQVEVKKDKKIREYIQIKTDEESWVRMNPSHLQQVLSNLVNNAVEELETKKERYIFFKSKKVGSKVIISITDNGRGIKKENLTKIFKPQYTTKVGDITNYGAGLGLSFAKRMIELYGGKIEVDSELAKGTTFTIILPYAQPTKKSLNKAS